MEKTRNGNNYNKIEVEKQFLFTLDQLITGDSWKCIDEIFFLNRPSRLKLPNKIAFSRADKEELITIFFLFCFIKGQNFICIPKYSKCINSKQWYIIRNCRKGLRTVIKFNVINLLFNLLLNHKRLNVSRNIFVGLEFCCCCTGTICSLCTASIRIVCHVLGWLQDDQTI